MRLASLLLLYIELEMYTTLSCTLLYAGVQLQRHEANRNQDYG